MIRRALALLAVCACSSGNAERGASTPPAAAAPAVRTAAPVAAAAQPKDPLATAAAPAVAKETPAAPAAPAPVEALGPEEGEGLFATACTSCHTAGFVQGSRISEKGWTAEVAKMRKWGALVDEEQAAPFAAWLALRFPAAEPAPEDPMMSAAAALATTAARPDRGPRGDPAHGKEVFAQACASCHGPGALGTGGGPALVENPVLGQRDRFALLIREGKGRMPGYDDLKSNDVASLLFFLRGLSRSP